MGVACSKCQHANRDTARFCSKCGRPLPLRDAPQPGRIPHPAPLPAPQGFVPCADACHAYFHWESAIGGGEPIGTEGVTIELFNAGFGLRDVELALVGFGRDAAPIFTMEETLDEWPRGGRRKLDVASYQLAEPVRVVQVRLRKAAFLQASD